MAESYELKLDFGHLPSTYLFLYKLREALTKDDEEEGVKIINYASSPCSLPLFFDAVSFCSQGFLQNPLGV